MLSSLTAGLLLGLSAGLAPGPLLTLVIAQTLQHSSCEGTKVALAPLITDPPIVAVSIFVLSELSGFEKIIGATSLAGAVYVLYLAYGSLLAGPLSMEPSESQPRSVRKGVLINALNPNPYLFWITVGAPFVLKSYAESPTAPFLFVLCFYVLLVASKVLLALAVGRSRSLLPIRSYVHVMRALGGLLALFAFILFRDALALLGVLNR